MKVTRIEKIFKKEGFVRKNKYERTLKFPVAAEKNKEKQWNRNSVQVVISNPKNQFVVRNAIKKPWERGTVENREAFRNKKNPFFYSSRNFNFFRQKTAYNQHNGKKFFSGRRPFNKFFKKPVRFLGPGFEGFDVDIAKNKQKELKKNLYGSLSVYSGVKQRLLKNRKSKRGIYLETRQKVKTKSVLKKKFIQQPLRKFKYLRWRRFYYGSKKKLDSFLPKQKKRGSVKKNNNFINTSKRQKGLFFGQPGWDKFYVNKKDNKGIFLKNNVVRTPMHYKKSKDFEQYTKSKSAGSRLVGYSNKKAFNKTIWQNRFSNNSFLNVRQQPFLQYKNKFFNNKNAWKHKKNVKHFFYVQNRFKAYKIKNNLFFRRKQRPYVFFFKKRFNSEFFFDVEKFRRYISKPNFFGYRKFGYQNFGFRTAFEKMRIFYFSRLPALVFNAFEARFYSLRKSAKRDIFINLSKADSLYGLLRSFRFGVKKLFNTSVSGSELRVQNIFSLLKGIEKNKNLIGRVANITKNSFALEKTKRFSFVSELLKHESFLEKVKKKKIIKLPGSIKKSLNEKFVSSNKKILFLKFNKVVPFRKFVKGLSTKKRVLKKQENLFKNFILFLRRRIVKEYKFPSYEYKCGFLKARGLKRLRKLKQKNVSKVKKKVKSLNRAFGPALQGSANFLFFFNFFFLGFLRKKHGKKFFLKTKKLRRMLFTLFSNKQKKTLRLLRFGLKKKLKYVFQKKIFEVLHLMFARVFLSFIENKKNVDFLSSFAYNQTIKNTQVLHYLNTNKIGTLFGKLLQKNESFLNLLGNKKFNFFYTLLAGITRKLLAHFVFMQKRLEFFMLLFLKQKFYINFLSNIAYNQRNFTRVYRRLRLEKKIVNCILNKKKSISVLGSWKNFFSYRIAKCHSLFHNNCLLFEKMPLFISEFEKMNSRLGFMKFLRKQLVLKTVSLKNKKTSIEKVKGKNFLKYFLGKFSLLSYLNRALSIISFNHIFFHERSGNTFPPYLYRYIKKFKNERVFKLFDTTYSMPVRWLSKHNKFGLSFFNSAFDDGYIYDPEELSEKDRAIFLSNFLRFFAKFKLRQFFAYFLGGVRFWRVYRFFELKGVKKFYSFGGRPTVESDFYFISTIPLFLYSLGYSPTFNEGLMMLQQGIIYVEGKVIVDPSFRINVGDLFQCRISFINKLYGDKFFHKVLRPKDFSVRFILEYNFKIASMIIVKDPTLRNIFPSTMGEFSGLFLDLERNRLRALKKQKIKFLKSESSFVRLKKKLSFSSLLLRLFSLLHKNIVCIIEKVGSTTPTLLMLKEFYGCFFRFKKVFIFLLLNYARGSRRLFSFLYKTVKYDSYTSSLSKKFFLFLLSVACKKNFYSMLFYNENTDFWFVFFNTNIAEVSSFLKQDEGLRKNFFLFPTQVRVFSTVNAVNSRRKTGLKDKKARFFNKFRGLLVRRIQDSSFTKVIKQKNLENFLIFQEFSCWPITSFYGNDRQEVLAEREDEDFFNSLFYYNRVSVFEGEELMLDDDILNLNIRRTVKPFYKEYFENGEFFNQEEEEFNKAIDDDVDKEKKTDDGLDEATNFRNVELRKYAVLLYGEQVHRMNFIHSFYYFHKLNIRV